MKIRTQAHLCRAAAAALAILSGLAFVNNAFVVVRWWRAFKAAGGDAAQMPDTLSGIVPWLDWTAVDYSCVTTFVPFLGFLLLSHGLGRALRGDHQDPEHFPFYKGYDQFNIALGDTLLNPQHESFEPFEAIVSNPPYSIKWQGDESPLLINDPRFSPAGVLAPKSKADMAFIMHCLAWLATSGTAAIVCFPGIMYRGGAERKIRQYLVDNNYVDCVIQLPVNLFFGTSIATCIMVLKKAKRDNYTLFIDASEMYVKVTNNNNFKSEHIERIVGLFADRADAKHQARLVSNSEVADQDYNLSVSTYVEKEDTREAVDIAELNAQIRQVTARVNDLRTQIDAIIAEIERDEDE